jgi:hypothetical protein
MDGVVRHGGNLTNSVPLRRGLAREGVNLLFNRRVNYALKTVFVKVDLSGH